MSFLRRLTTRTIDSWGEYWKTLLIYGVVYVVVTWCLVAIIMGLGSWRL